MVTLVITINIIILIYFIILAAQFIVLNVMSFPMIRDFFKRYKVSELPSFVASDNMPPVSVIIPIYNEKERAINAIQSAIRSDYPRKEIILVNDGSTDDTLQILIDYYDLFPVSAVIPNSIETQEVRQVYLSHKEPDLYVVDKEHYGSADSVNVGVNAATSPYIMTFDADSFMEKDALSELVFSIMSKSNVVACGGSVFILNNCKHADGVMSEPKFPERLVPSFQAIEYMRANIFGRISWNAFGGYMCYSGSATVLDRKSVIDSGGYDRDNFAYDAEIVFRMHARRHEMNKDSQIMYNPIAFTWTTVPKNLKQYCKQRINWHRGLLRTTKSYYKMFLNPKYGLQGFFNYPSYLLTEIYSPYVEFMAYAMILASYLLGILNGKMTILFIVLAWGFLSLLTMSSAFLNYMTFNKYKKLSDLPKIFLLTIPEVFGFRQIHVVVRIYATFKYIFSRKNGRRF